MVSIASPSPDSQVILLLCSHLALARSIGDPKPLSRAEWNDVARAIDASPLKRPAALLGASADSIARGLGIGSAMASRISALLDRGGQLAIELERLKSLGIWTLTRVDAQYPLRLKERLKAAAPPVLCGAGPLESLSARGVAIVGSRDVDESGSAFASELGRLCASAGLTVFSGGAKGVDRLAIEGALDEDGRAVVVLADSLQDSLRRKDLRDRVLDGRLTLMTPSSPSARFTVAAAMGRNKLIYALSSAAVVVSSARESGGTWAGAIENLRAGWVPLFVRNGAGVPDGNRELINRGARALDGAHLASARDTILEAIASHSGAALVRESRAAFADDSAEADLNGGPGESPDRLDLFPFVWPRLHAYLSEPRTEAEIAQAFHLHEVQVRAWLERAREQGLIRRLDRPTRFERVPDVENSQASLFDA